MADRNGYIGRAPGDSSITVARETFEPSGSTTDFTFAVGYDPGYCDVYLNGSRLIAGTDYIAGNGSTVVLTTAAQNGDILEIVAYKAFNMGQAITQVTGNFDLDGKLTVSGISSLTDVVSSGIITADYFYGDGSNLTNQQHDSLWKQNSEYSGISTTATVGIGTTRADSIARVNNTTILNVGIVTAYQLYGDGSNLTALNASNISSGTIGAARVPTLNQNTTGTASFATTSVVPGISTQLHSVFGTVNISGIATAATINAGAGVTITASGIVNAGFTTITGATETVTGVTTYLVPDSSSTKVTIECDASKGTLFSHDMSNGNVGIVSLTNLPVRGNSFTTYTILFTQLSSTPVGTGNTLPKNGIGTNVYLDGGFTGFSTRGRVATASTVTLSTTASDIDVVTLGVHYNGSGTAGKENFKVLVTSNTGYRVGND